MGHQPKPGMAARPPMMRPSPSQLQGVCTAAAVKAAVTTEPQEHAATPTLLLQTTHAPLQTSPLTRRGLCSGPRHMSCRHSLLMMLPATKHIADAVCNCWPVPTHPRLAPTPNPCIRTCSPPARATSLDCCTTPLPAAGDSSLGRCMAAGEATSIVLLLANISGVLLLSGLLLLRLLGMTVSGPCNTKQHTHNDNDSARRALTRLSDPTL